MENLLLYAGALSDPTRLKLLRLLLERESAVHELVDVLATGQSRVSMHLARLRSAGLVRERRDGRQVYYSTDAAALSALDRELQQFLGTPLGELPALRAEWQRWQRRFAPAAAGSGPEPAGAIPIRFRPEPAGAGRHTGRPLLLFLCTANSFRSQIAEAWARHLSGGSLPVQSAGLEPARLNPLAVRLMAEVGVEMAGQHAKPITPALLAAAGVVVTVCGTAPGWFPDLPPGVRREHWPFPDPTRDAARAAVALAEGRRVRDGIRRRVEALLRSLDQAS